MKRFKISVLISITIFLSCNNSPEKDDKQTIVPKDRLSTEIYDYEALEFDTSNYSILKSSNIEYVVVSQFEFRVFSVFGLCIFAPCQNLSVRETQTYLPSI
jgi:hypothetical protein